MQNGLLNFIQTFFKNSLLLLVYIHFFIVFYYYKFFSFFYLALFKYPRLAVSLTIVFSFILLDIYIPIDLWELFFKLLNSTHRSFLSFFFLMIFGLVVFLFLMALFFLFVTLPHFIFLLQTNYMFEVYIIILESISIFLPFLLAVAYLTLMERKVLGSIQLRRGPDIVGPFGILQPISDALKLVVKELVAPYVSNKPVFMLAPILTFFFAFFGLIMLPFYHFHVVFDMELSLMLFFGLSTLGVYGIILAGWASNSRYAFLGSLRSTAQLISYEVSLGLVIQTVALPCSSVAFVDIVNFQILHGWFIFPFFITFLLFLISTLAEVNRPPFDLPEAEAELVSGYNVEYSSTTFALFFIGEYANVITSTLVTVFFFFGGCGTSSFFGPFVLSFKILFFLWFFLVLRAALPRFRYDQLIQFGWKGILPISFSWFIFTCVLFYFITT